MNVKVEATWNGHANGFRLTMPDGKREQVTADKWDRKTASWALNILEHVYRVKRSLVRFIHH